MAVAFTRQLGAESGVQLNPLRDNSEIPALDNSDQIFGIIMRATRGRIDKPFKVDRGNVFKKLGNGESIRVTALNEAWVHVVEALNNGAYEAVVQRLVPAEAELNWIVVHKSSNVTSFTVGTDGEEPDTPYTLAIKHLDCYNDGVKISIHADENRSGGVNQPNSTLTLRILDPADSATLYEFTGSLIDGAKDDYGQSAYLPDVVSRQTDAIEVKVGVTGAAAQIEITEDCYGYDDSGQEQWATSGALLYFTEGGTSYTTQIYMAARDKLQYTDHNYAYISSGGTQNPALLAQLAQLAFDTNRQLRFDIPGSLSIEAAIAFVEQLNMGASKTAHLMHAFWHPVTADDPTGINATGYFGVATLNIAYACGRNAETNSKGFAPKNYPIAGREWPIARTNMKQRIFPRDQEFNQLAKAKINPAIYDVYTGGGRYVFKDSLTCALVESSLKKLISVADMSAHIDEAVTRYCKDILQQPMDIAVKRTKAFLTALFEGAEASGWLVPSNDPEMGGASWKHVVQPNRVRPYDRMDVSYWLRYDGVARQIFVTHTLTR
jgi:hypothetical protein